MKKHLLTASFLLLSALLCQGQSQDRNSIPYNPSATR